MKNKIHFKGNIVKKNYILSTIVTRLQEGNQTTLLKTIDFQYIGKQKIDYKNLNKQTIDNPNVEKQNIYIQNVENKTPINNPFTNKKHLLISRLLYNTSKVVCIHININKMFLTVDVFPVDIFKIDVFEIAQLGKPETKQKVLFFSIS